MTNANVKSAEQSFLRALISLRNSGKKKCSLAEIGAEMSEDLSLLELTTIRDNLIEEGLIEKVNEESELHTITENGEYASDLVW